MALLRPNLFEILNILQFIVNINIATKIVKINCACTICVENMQYNLNWYFNIIVSYCCSILAAEKCSAQVWKNNECDFGRWSQNIFAPIVTAKLNLK